MIVQVSNEINSMATILRNVRDATRANEEDLQEMLRENERIDSMFPHLRESQRHEHQPRGQPGEEHQPRDQQSPRN